MIGSFRWNLLAGLIGFCGTMLISLPKNVWKTALVQSAYSFLFLFIFLFAVRWVLGFMIQASNASAPAHAVPGDTKEEAFRKGQSIDLSTPDEGVYPQDPAAAPAEDSGFAPLNPPKLTTKLDANPEDLVKALRHMSEE